MLFCVFAGLSKDNDEQTDDDKYKVYGELQRDGEVMVKVYSSMYFYDTGSPYCNLQPSATVAFYCAKGSQVYVTTWWGADNIRTTRGYFTATLLQEEY